MATCIVVNLYAMNEASPSAAELSLQLTRSPCERRLGRRAVSIPERSKDETAIAHRSHVLMVDSAHYRK